VRVSLGQIGPITLYDGTVIANPSTTMATAAQCLPYQCGKDSSNTAAIQWCSLSGQVGAKTCGDVECAPYCPPPAPVNAPAPATPKPPVQAAPILPGLTPANVTQPLPDITATLAPTPVATQSCSFWCDLNSMIAENPLVAVGILAGAAFLMWPKGAR
jgi:hypothetical protein